MNNQNPDVSLTNGTQHSTEKHDPEVVAAYIKNHTAISRKYLNVQAFIGMFIFGWLMQLNYNALGEKGFGWAFLIAMAFVFAIGRQVEPMIFFAVPIIYVAAWIHTNALLTSKQRIAREQFFKENTKNSAFTEEVNKGANLPAGKTNKWILITGLFFAICISLIGAVIGLDLLQGKSSQLPPTSHNTALIELQGNISQGTPASADNIIASLRAAYSEHTNKGVIILLNSTGGSMVEAGNIHDEIRRLRNKYPIKPLYVVIKDVCTSACYYVAVAADDIYVNSASLVGSIGTTMITSHINDAIKKSKSEYGYIEHIDNIKKIQNNIHQNVVNAVRTGRGMRLSKSNEIFSGSSWDGEMAVKLGLVDGLGNASYISREIIGAENIVKYSFPESTIKKSEIINKKGR